MSPRPPDPITPPEARRRRDRARRVARAVGFVGRVEYRHVLTQSGGAQYGQGVGADDDLLVVYAEAFARDADPDDFTLRAILAHERGHQLIARDPRLADLSAAAEEVVASVLGAWVVGPGEDRDALLAKATVEVLGRGTPADDAVRIVGDLWGLLGELL